MAKAMATRTKQRVDANQELIGQGLANVGGSFFQSYPAEYSPRLCPATNRADLTSSTAARW